MYDYINMQSTSFINYLSDGKNMHWSHGKRQQVYYISKKLFWPQINIKQIYRL